MKIAILGTGTVGQTIGKKLVQLGHEVRMGSRSAKNEAVQAFVKEAGGKASAGTFEDAALFCDLAFNCTRGSASIAAITLTGSESLQGKILIDVSNPLDTSKGAPTLFTGRDDSLGEQIQREIPSAKVVKTLNTVNANIMVDASRFKGEHDMFLCGNDQGAKEKVSGYLREWFGWKSITDLGDITGARAMESYVQFWARVWGATKSAHFNIKLVRE